MDSSGDSDEDDSEAKKYKDYLTKIDDLMRNQMGNEIKDDDNISRTLDLLKKEIFNPNISEVNVQNSLNLADDKHDDLKKDLVVPLFHAVPFMVTQYTNYERRKVFEEIHNLNKRLKDNKKDDENLENDRANLFNIYSRTATASCGIQSLFEMDNRDKYNMLTNSNETLFGYFKNHIKNEARFIEGMQIYVNNFKEGKTKEFWEKMKNAHESNNYPEMKIIKYRFPIIATSKTPDHPSNFGIGNNVEGQRGETALKPIYRDGKPTHRLAGLLYVSLHSIDEIKNGLNDKTIIDVNHSGIPGGHLHHQLEVDFMGKISGKVVAIIPIVYPNIIKPEKFKKYHQNIYGMYLNNNQIVTCPNTILRNLEIDPNPDTHKKESFGKFIHPSIVNLANGIALAFASLDHKFLYTFTKDKKLIQYNLKFDYDEAYALSKMHRILVKQEKKNQRLIRKFYQI